VLMQVSCDSHKKNLFCYKGTGRFTVKWDVNLEIFFTLNSNLKVLKKHLIQINTYFSKYTTEFTAGLPETA